MFARLVSAQGKVDKLNEMIRIWKEKDMPLMKSVKGYRGAYLLTDRKTGRGTSMTLWDSEEDSIADEQSALHRKQLDMYKGLFTGEITHQRYEISARDKI